MNKNVLHNTIAKSWFWTFAMVVSVLLQTVLVSTFWGPFPWRGVGFMLLLSVFMRETQAYFERQNRPSRENNATLFECLDELIQELRAWSKPKLYFEEQDSPQAFAENGIVFGFSRIRVTRSILECLNHHELKAVLAHELAHIRCKDTFLRMFIHSFVFITSCYILLKILFWDSSLPISLLPFVLMFNFIQLLLGRAVSRQTEYRADALAVLYLRSPLSLVNAIEKLLEITKTEQANHDPSLFSRLLLEQPLLRDRLASLKNLS